MLNNAGLWALSGYVKNVLFQTETVIKHKVKFVEYIVDFLIFLWIKPENFNLQST